MNSMSKKTYPIDFVVTWLDSSDPNWQKDYMHYKQEGPLGDFSDSRFRDWGLFKFWFRSVETYAPWVNKIFLVTNGKIPDWINENHPKLVLVKHSDYIPEKFLPTFNSCTIELHLNKIKGLSEHFVYFNDDCFVNSPVSPEYYFKKGLPCDNNKETFLNVPIYHKEYKMGIFPSILTNIGVVNANFERWNTVRQSLKKWFGPHLGIKGIILSGLLGRQRKFIGFNIRHFEQPFLKSVFDEAWTQVPDLLNKSCTRFREELIINPYFFRYWQFATNKFYPVKLKNAKHYRIVRFRAKEIEKAIGDSNIKSLCINDTQFCSQDDYNYMKGLFERAFLQKLPNKSTFEK